MIFAFFTLAAMLLIFNLLFTYFVTPYASTVGGLWSLLFHKKGFHLIRNLTIMVLICLASNYVLLVVALLRTFRNFGPLEITPSGMRWGYDVPVIVALFSIEFGLSKILKKRDMGGSNIDTTQQNINLPSTNP